MLRNRKSPSSGRQARRRPVLRPVLRSTPLEVLEERKLLSAAAIIAENALPGTSSDIWDIQGSGSASIQGFAAQLSVNHGERVDFKIDTNADDYRIDIYRTGYYGGLGARHITTINPNASLANNQPNPITDFNTGLVDAGNWRVSASWDVPQTAVSGVYIAKLTREDGTNGESHIIFVVRDDEGHSDILLQTSDTNWVAYSDYGGSSLYGNNFLPNGRAYAVSYNRPLTTRSRAESTFFFGAEYPMVRFLEANGFDVSYTTGIDTDRRGAELLEHKIFVSVGHDEYWSGQQRANVEAARDAGVNLAFLSGNEVFWKHRWADSIAGPTTPYTTMVIYKETHANAKIDPMADVWTGTWRDPRFSPPADGGRPENALTGTIFTVNGDSIIGRKITVGAADGKMRFWRNTSVANLTGNQTVTVGDYVLGYEWDEDLDNGFRPAGLMHLSTTTANVSAYIQDYGNTYAPGTATHHLTLYRATSGALVFGAGTIQYSWGLDSFHDGPAANTDIAMQQATVNLFADMGVQPGGLRPGLVTATMSTDFTAPTSAITMPTDGMIVSAGTSLTIRGTALDQGGGRVAAVEVSVDGGVTWHPAVGREDWTYTWTPRSSGMVNIRSRASDDSGNLETAGPGVTINPPLSSGVYTLWDTGTVPSTVDSGDSAAVEVGVRFRVDTPGHITSLRFYKSTANTGTHVAHLWTSTGTLLASATFSNETGNGWQQVDFAAPVAVSPGTTYIASYTAPKGHYSVTRSYFTSLGVDNGPLHAVAEGAGQNGVYNYSPGSFPNQSYQASNYWVDVVLNTSIAPDTTAPNVTRFGQAGGGTNVTVGSAFTVTFSEALNASTVNTTTVTIVKPDARLIPGGCCPTPGGWCSGCPLLTGTNNTPVNANVSYDANTKTATITPAALLDPSTIYTIIVNGGGVKDLAGNSIATDVWSSVLTSNQPAPVQSTFWNAATTPTTIDSTDNAAVELGMRFAATIDGLVTGARFYKASTNTGTHTASLWNSSGQRLATATFSNETASGWQQVDFASPVAITAGATYTISYHTGSGHYSVARNYFTAPITSGALQAPANAGVYAYGTGSIMPSDSYQGSNYYVDVIFSNTPPGDTVAPTITNFNPFDGTGNVPVNPSVKIYFSEAMDPATIIPATVKLLDGGNNAVPATLSYDAATRTATLTPTSTLAYAMNYTIFVLGGSAGVRDLAGNTMAQNTTSAFTTEVGTQQDTTPPTISAFSPVNGAVAVDPNATFSVTFSEPMNAATVKSSTVYLLKNGTQLAATTLVYNAATQTATLTPVSPLLPDTSYTIYVLGGSTGVKDLFDNALAQNTASVFQTAAAAPGDAVAPTIVGFTPTGTGVAVNTSVTVTFSEALDPTTVNATNIQLRHAISGVAVASTLSYTAGDTVVTLVPTSALSASTNYLVVVQGGASGVRDVVGNALANTLTSAFTTAAPADTTPPTVTAFSPANGALNQSTSTAIKISFSEPLDASTVDSSTVFLQNASNVVVPATVAYNASTGTVSITPTSPLAGSMSYTIVVKGGSAGVKDAAGNALATDATSAFTTATPPAQQTSFSLWPTTTVPGTVDAGDNQSVELGVKFSATTSGYISGIRFYKSAANTGAHTGSLWSASGQLLATATFANETASGWQEVTFSTPVAITSGTTYVASYHTTTGHYSVNRNYFTSQFTSGLLRVPTNGGVYRYGANTVFPNSTYQRSNYWVDVVMTTIPPVDTTAPTVTAFSPTSGSSSASTTAAPTVTFSEALNASTVNTSTVFLRDASNVVVPTTVAYNASNRTVTLTPSSALANSTSYTIVVKGGASGVKDAAGNALAADVTSSFTTAAPAPPSSLWGPSTTPGTVDSGDDQSVELGVKFSATVNGFITGLRFYKSAANTGPHTASLWTSTGQLLAQATFTNETASGWQQVLFATPVAITAGTTYVASYHTTSGHYSVTRYYFTSQLSSGYLRVPTSGGVYSYGANSLFPTSTYQRSNYWVDVLFVPQT